MITKENSVKDIVLVGHFALDTIVNRRVQPETISHSLGGGVTYGSLAAAFYNPKSQIGIVSRIGKDLNGSMLSILNNRKIDQRGIVQAGELSTGYKLVYHEKGRDLMLMNKAPNIEIADFPESFIAAKAIHMTPIANEFSPEFIKDLADHDATQETLIGIDVQGIIRDFDKDHNVIMRNDNEIRQRVYKILQQFGSRMFFKASDAEAIACTGITDLVKATEYLAETGAYIFTTLGEKGLYMKAPGHPIVKLPAYRPRQCVDETGAGDCFSATLLLQMAQLDPKQRSFEHLKEATNRAMASSSFLIEEKGPHGYGSESSITKRVLERNVYEYE
jgi:sugar/nucleoside kinase (ribokinase family)